MLSQYTETHCTGLFNQPHRVAELMVTVTPTGHLRPSSQVTHYSSSSCLVISPIQIHAQTRWVKNCTQTGQKPAELSLCTRKKMAELMHPSQAHQHQGALRLQASPGLSEHGPLSWEQISPCWIQHEPASVPLTTTKSDCIEKIQNRLFLWKSIILFP